MYVVIEGFGYIVLKTQLNHINVLVLYCYVKVCVMTQIILLPVKCAIKPASFNLRSCCPTYKILVCIGLSGKFYCLMA